MPFEKSSSKKATENNFDEFRHGRTFKKTAAKFGKNKARKQMIAAVLSNKRKYEKKGVGSSEGTGKYTQGKKHTKKAAKRYGK